MEKLNKEKYLSLEERTKIKEGLNKHLGCTEISKHLYRIPVTIIREVNRNGGVFDYDPVKAHENFLQRMQEKYIKISNTAKLKRCDNLRRSEKINFHKKTDEKKSNLIESRIDSLEMQIEIILEILKEIKNDTKNK